ncbi:MAG: CDP-alcohol phosphatidyltransferase family protein [Ekhidna sp.]
MLKRKFDKHLEEVLSTIKQIDIEERYDIYFSRFYGLYFAKMGKWLSLTPTHVSLLSLLLGVIGGGLLFFQNSTEIVLIGGVLITLAGVLDSADGQLARMTGQSTELGRSIDGVIDNVVFLACYVGGAVYFFPTYGWLIIVLAGISGYTHSYKTALYEFYKAEYLLLIGKSEAGNMPISSDELKSTGDSFHNKILDGIYKDYIKKTLIYTTRTPEQRLKMRSLAKEGNNNFDSLYSYLNKKMLFWWAWLCGSNTHRNAIIIFAFFGRFDLYLICSSVWTLAIIPLNYRQKRFDKKLLEES